MNSLSRWCLSSVVAAATMAALAPLARAGDVTLEVSAECPGRLTLRWSGAEPSRPMAIFFARESGEYRIPGTYCSRMYLGPSESGLRFVRIVRSGSGGSGSVAGQAGGGECVGYVQLLVVGSQSPSCETSNVVQIP